MANTDQSLPAPASTPIKTNSSKRRAGALAKIACVGCRRLKMKCITLAEDSSCLRCAKAKRPCILPLPTKQTSSTTPPITPLQTPALSSDNFSDDSPWTISPVTRRPSLSRSYTTPMMSSLHWASPPSETSKDFFAPTCSPIGLGLSFGNAQPLSMQHIVKAPSISTTSIVSDDTVSQDVITREEFLHLDQFFATHLLSQVLVISDHEVNDLAALIDNKRPLATAMAYVAAHFVPGCKSIRARLTPAVVSLATLQNQRHARDMASDEERWALLQALAVLYTYAPFQSHGISTTVRSELTREMLRMSIEALAVKYSMHSSAQDAAEALRHTTSTSQVCTTFAVRKYIFWLWLYSEAHLRSLVTRSPSSLREDASITLASNILDRVIDVPHIRRIVAVVELCLLWTRNDLRQRGFGEWYCSTPNRLTPDTISAMLSEMDESIGIWQSQWKMAPPPAFAAHSQTSALSNAFVSLQQHFVHFCNALYATQALRASYSTDDNTTALINFENQTTDRALRLCNFLREMSPLTKSLIGYSSESFFAMVSFCCDHIVQVRKNSSSGLDNMGYDRFGVVLEVAELLIEVGADDLHSAKVIGLRIQRDFIGSRPPAFDFGSVDSRSCRSGLHQRSCSADLLSLPHLLSDGSTGNSSIESGCNSGLTSGSQSPELSAAMLYKSWSTADLGHCQQSLSFGDDTSATLMDFLPSVGQMDNSMQNDIMWFDEANFSPPTFTF